MPHLRKKMIRFFAPSTKQVLRRLIVGFIGFIASGGLIFLANAYDTELLAAIAIGGMVAFALLAILGYVGVWYFRYRSFVEK